MITRVYCFILNTLAWSNMWSILAPDVLCFKPLGFTVEIRESPMRMSLDVYLLCCVEWLQVCDAGPDLVLYEICQLSVRLRTSLPGCCVSAASLLPFCWVGIADEFGCCRAADMGVSTAGNCFVLSLCWVISVSLIVSITVSLDVSVAWVSSTVL